MGLVNPNNSSEILYGISGDVRNEINAYTSPASAGHYIDESEIPGSMIIRGLQKATRIINSYLEVVYANSIPVSTTNDVPLLLDEIASDLATYYVWRSNTARLLPIPEDKKLQYYDAHISEPDGTLPLIRERKMQLPEFTSGYGDEVKAVRTSGRAPIFDLDSELNWRVDPDEIDDIERERKL